MHLLALRHCTDRTTHRRSRGIALTFHEHGARRRWGIRVTPQPLFTPGKTRYPLYRRLGGSQGRSEQVWKISPPPGFDPRTVQPLGQSLYRLCYPAHAKIGIKEKLSIKTWGKNNTMHIKVNECLEVDCVECLWTKCNHWSLVIRGRTIRFHETGIILTTCSTNT